MFNEMEKRAYKMRQRAQAQEQTRRKIVEATAELHGSAGPAKTTISAVAEKAGVQRLTVYRHFPDEAALFRACSSHWLGLNPPPDPKEWMGIPKSSERTETALLSLFDYYERTASMWALVYRDIDLVPAMRAPVEEFHAYLDAIRDDLVSAWRPKGRKPKMLIATIGHLTRFATWSSLHSLELSNQRAAELALRWITASK